MQVSSQDSELARVLLAHSLKIKPKEKVLISVAELGLPLGKAVYQETLKLGAYPLLDVNVNGMEYPYYQLANQWQLSYVPSKVVKAKIEWADAFVRIVAEDNLRELAQIDSQKIADRSKLVRPLWDPVIDSDRWVLTWYPTSAMAQEAGVSTDWLREFYFGACLVDYAQMGRKLKSLEKLMDRGKLVHIVGQMTDLRVQIGGRLAQACAGERNIPDGECFLAPVTDGIEGEIYFEFPTLVFGHEVAGIHLEFSQGKVVKAQAERGNEALQKMLATDSGARYTGELAIGTNYQITQGMLNTLFDEKIGGTIHLALGRAYKEKRGGGENKSAIHWDLVKDMRLAGSTLTIDGKIILREGKLLV